MTRKLWSWGRRDGRPRISASRAPGSRGLRRPLSLEELESRTLLSGNGLSDAILLAFAGGQAAATGALDHGARFYALTVNADGLLTAQVHATTCPTRLSLLDSTGQVLAQSDGQSAANPDDLIDLHVTGLVGGTRYYLEVEGLGRAVGTFDLRADFATATAPFQPLPIDTSSWGHAFDLRGNGILDLVTVSWGTGNLSVLLGRGDGTFAPAVKYGLPDTPADVIAGDLTGSGVMDLVTVNASGDLSVLMGRGDGTFADPTYTAVNVNPSAMIAGDFTGNGRVDLAITDSVANDVCVLMGNGDGTFAAPQYYAVGAQPQAVIAADVNRDGHLDLATCNAADNTVSVLLNEGDGTFLPAHSYAVGTEPTTLVAGDFRGDGHIDIATANNGSNDVSVLLGNGDGTFGTTTRLAAGGGADCIVAGHFYGDGHLDLATTNQAAGSLSVFRGRGDGTFAPQITIPVGAAPGFLVAADFNRDGHEDLGYGDSLGHIIVGLGRGDGTFQLQPPASRAAGDVSLKAADLNGDGRLDLVTVNNATNDIQVLLGRGDGTFQIGGRYATGGTSPTAVAVGDFNGDGIPDLAVTNGFSNNVSIFLGRGDGTFGPPTLYATGNSPNDLVVGDFGNGHLDLAVADYADNTVSVLLGNGDGTFQRAVTYAVGSGPDALVAADLNGDGNLDLAVADINSSDVSLLYGNGDGTFARAVEVPTGGPPTAIVAGDFTGTGITDLATTSWDSVSVLLGQPAGKGKPSGTFAQPVTYRVNGGVNGLAVGDFNGDGNLDLATAKTSGGMTVLSGNGDGTFRVPRPFYYSWRGKNDGPQAVVAGDFNGDGATDLAVANLNSDDVAVWLGNGDGTFGAQLRTPVPGGPLAIAQADLTNNGNSDLVTANFDGGTVSVRLGNGDGTFQDPVNYAVGNGPDAVIAADFNSDGRLDLATANFLDGTVSVLFGIGDGTFQARHTYRVGSEPDAIVSGDFNGDGIPDLAVANFGSGTVSILLGRRDGSFQAPITVAVGQGPDALAVAEVNGLPELVVGDGVSQDVRVLLGDGHGHFRALAPVALPAAPVSVVTGDFTGHGVADVAVACPAAGGIFLLPGLGGGALGAPQLVATPTAPIAVVAGAFTTDGRLDLAYADSSANVVGILLGQGDGTFKAQAPYDVGSYPLALVAGDFSNDGRLGLATANGLGVPVSVCLGLGDGTCVDVTKAASPVRSAPLVADFTGDGVPDVVVLRQDGKILFRPGRPGQPGAFGPPVVVNPDPAWAARDVVVGRGPGGMNYLFAVSSRSNTDALYAYVGGQFVPVYVGTLPSAVPSFVLVGDVNGDGLGDLITASAATGEIDITLQRPNDDFSEHGCDYQLFVSPGISSITLADLNGNGLPDIVVTNRVTGEVTVLVNSATNPFSTRLVFRSGTGLTGLGTYNGWADVQSEDAPAAVVAGLFTGGTVPDLAVLNSGADRVDLLAADGEGGVYNPAPAASLLTGQDPVALVTGDFNGDGQPDLAVLNKGSNDVSIFLGDGHGHFTKRETIPAGNAPTGLAVADVNGDGKLDLLVSNAQGDVLTLVGNGDGTFQPYQRLDGHVALAVAGVDCHGRQEFVLASAAQDQVSLLSGQGGPGFVQGRQDGVLKPNAVVLADLTGDGIPDLVVANGGGNNVLVYPGLGDGRFGAPQSFAVGTDPVSVTVADVTGNGIPDLVVANEGSNDVSVLFGHGRGADWTLLPGPRLQAGSGPVATAVADVHGTGTPDILVANSQSNDVYLLRGVGGGFFDDHSPTIFPTGQDPQQLFVGDFGGGAGLSLVTVNAGSNDLSYFPGFGPERRLASGGLDPTAAVAGDFAHDGRTDLVVLNSGDNRVALLMAGADGPTVAAVLTPNNLTNLSDLALGAVRGQALDVYVTTAGEEAVTALTFALDQATAPADGALLQPDSARPAGTEVSALPDLPLGLVVTLLVGGNSAAVGSPGGPADSQAPAGESSQSDRGSVSPAVWTASVEDAGTEGSSEAAALAGAPAAGESAINLNAFITGSADDNLARVLTGPDKADAEQGLATPLPPPALFDFGDTRPTPARAPEQGAAPGQDGATSPEPVNPAAGGPVSNPSEPQTDGSETRPAAPQPAQPGEDKAAPAAEGASGETSPLPTSEHEADSAASVPAQVWGLAVALVQALRAPRSSRQSRRDKHPMPRRK
jgi:hypothetical protein